MFIKLSNRPVKDHKISNKITPGKIIRSQFTQYHTQTIVLTDDPPIKKRIPGIYMPGILLFASPLELTHFQTSG